MKIRRLHIWKDGHQYIFHYQAGNEENLFYVLINMARDDECKFGLVEALHLIRKINVHLREGKGDKQLTIRL